MITRRTRTPEMMDDPDVEPEALEESLRFIRMVNRRLGGTGALVGRLKRWAAGWDPTATIRLIDLGTGSADIPLAVSRWARRAGHRVRITAVDAHPATLSVARRLTAGCDDIEVVEADARLLMERYDPGSFDYAHAGMFLHHLEDIEVLTVLRIMDRLSTRGIVWNDLVRGAPWRLAVRLLTAGRAPMIRHDGRASVAAGFTRREALDLARRAGLARIEHRRHLAGRFTLATTKP